MQEAYRPLRIKYSIWCPISGGGVPHFRMAGTPPLHGRYPTSGQGGTHSCLAPVWTCLGHPPLDLPRVCLDLAWVFPVWTWPGFPLSGPGLGTPLSGPGLYTPLSRPGQDTPLSGPGYGTPLSGPGQSTPCLDLAMVPPVWTWLWYPPVWTWLWYPLSGPGYGTPLSGPGYGTPLSGPSYGTPCLDLARVTICLDLAKNLSKVPVMHNDAVVGLGRQRGKQLINFHTFFGKYLSSSVAPPPPQWLAQVLDPPLPDVSVSRIRLECGNEWNWL